MSGEETLIYGISLGEWEAAYGSDVAEFAASKFALMSESGLVRIAFGNSGPPLDEKGKRGVGTYTVAVSITPELALDMGKAILKTLATPEKQKS